MAAKRHPLPIETRAEVTELTNYRGKGPHGGDTNHH